MKGKCIASIDEYISSYPPEIRKTLKTLRRAIKEVAPGAEEKKMSWQMPTFALHGNLVHFAVAKNHAFKRESAKYKGTKGSLHLPMEEPLPYALVSRIVKFRVAENMKQATHGLKKKK